MCGQAWAAVTDEKPRESQPQPASAPSTNSHDSCRSREKTGCTETPRRESGGKTVNENLAATERSGSRANGWRFPTRFRGWCRRVLLYQIDFTGQNGDPKVKVS